MDSCLVEQHFREMLFTRCSNVPFNIIYHCAKFQMNRSILKGGTIAMKFKIRFLLIISQNCAHDVMGILLMEPESYLKRQGSYCQINKCLKLPQQPSHSQAGSQMAWWCGPKYPFTVGFSKIAKTAALLIENFPKNPYKSLARQMTL